MAELDIKIHGIVPNNNGHVGNFDRRLGWEKHHFMQSVKRNLIQADGILIQQRVAMKYNCQGRHDFGLSFTVFLSSIPY